MYDTIYFLKIVILACTYNYLFTRRNLLCDSPSKCCKNKRKELHSSRKPQYGFCSNASWKRFEICSVYHLACMGSIIPIIIFCKCIIMHDIHELLWILHIVVFFVVWLSISSLCINTSCFLAPRVCFNSFKSRYLTAPYIVVDISSEVGSIHITFCYCVRNSYFALIDLNIVIQILRNDLDLFTQTQTCLLICLYKTKGSRHMHACSTL